MVKISDRGLYTLFVIILVMSISTSVYASAPSHGFDVIGPPLGCNAGESLQWTGNGWTCGIPEDSRTDTTCSDPGACSQVCIGTDCRSSWPTLNVWSVNGEGELYINDKVRVGTDDFSLSPMLLVENEITSVDSSGEYRAWGKGRPGVALLTDFYIMDSGYKAELGNIRVHWSGVEAGCPAGSWVCRADELSGTPGSSTDSGWLADVGDNYNHGKAYSKTGGFSSLESNVNALKVWCCAYGSCDIDEDGQESDNGICSGNDCNDFNEDAYFGSIKSYRGAGGPDVNCDGEVEMYWSETNGAGYTSGIIAAQSQIIADCGVLPEVGCTNYYGQTSDPGSALPTSCDNTLYLYEGDYEDAGQCYWDGDSCEASGAPLYLQRDYTYYSWCK